MNKNNYFDEVAFITIYGIFASSVWGYMFSACSGDIYNKHPTLILFLLNLVKKNFFNIGNDVYNKQMMSVLASAHMFSIYVWYRVLQSVKVGEKRYSAGLYIMIIVLILNVNIYNYFTDKIIENFFVLTVFAILYSLFLVQRYLSLHNFPEEEMVKERYENL